MAPSTYSGNQPAGWRRWRRAQDHADRAPHTAAALLHFTRLKTASEWAHNQPVKLQKVWRRHYDITQNWVGNYGDRKPDGVTERTTGYTCSAFCAALKNIMDLGPNPDTWDALLSRNVGDIVSYNNGSHGGGYAVNSVNKVDVVKPRDLRQPRRCHSCNREMNPVTRELMGTSAFDTRVAADEIRLEMNNGVVDAQKMIDILAGLKALGVSPADLSQIVDFLATKAV